MINQNPVSEKPQNQINRERLLVVFHGMREWEESRWLEKYEHFDQWLEYFCFSRYSDSSIKYSWTFGLFGTSSHHDGGGGTNQIPAEWLQLSWEEFLERFYQEAPSCIHAIKKEELEQNKKLKVFLGFASEAEDPKEP